ncbi:expansin-like B1 [Chenopodium quinoa]|nr:expansin-like B1 [Chenopodium quinoa]
MRKMAFTFIQNYAILIVMAILLPTLCHSTDEQEMCKATYYGSSYCKSFPVGACGYGPYGKTANGVYVAAISKLFRNGTGCGACYQVKCKAPECNEEGVKVVATDHAFTYDADFILSAKVYAKMAKPGKEMDLLDFEYVNIEYERVPCKYPGKNVMVKVHEHSFFPHYLALVLLNQGGMYDITAVEIYEEDTQDRKAYGAVWDMHNPPKGELTMRFYACGSGTTEGKWMVASNVVPAYWKAGLTVETNVQLS